MGHHDILQIWINCKSQLVAETYHVSEKHSKMPKIVILSYIIAAPKDKYLKSSLVFVRLASLCANSWEKKNLKRWCSNTCHVWFEMEPKFFWEAIQNRVYEPRLHLPFTYSKSDSLNKSIQEYFYFFFNIMTSLHTTRVYGFCRQHINMSYQVPSFKYHIEIILT